MKESKTPVMTPLFLATLIISVLLAAFALGFAMYYTVSGASAEFHADCSDTLYWAQASVESGRIISRSFSYSALLPFGGQLIMMPAIAMFGFSMKAQVAGMAVFLLIFTAALLLMFRTVGFGWRMSCLSIFVSLMSFSLSQKLREIFFSHVIYYSLGILLFALLLSLVMRFIRAGDEKNRKKYMIYADLLFLLTAATATDGAQLIVISVCPILFALLFLILLDDTRTKIFSGENRPRITAFICLIVGSAVGLVILKLMANGVSAGYADGYSTYDSMKNWIVNLLAIPEQYFSLLGVKITERDPMFSVNSVLYMLRIVFGLAIFVLPLVSLFRWKKLRSDGTKMLVLGHLFVLCFIIYGYIFGKLGAAAWRLIPAYGTGIFASLASVRELMLDEALPERRMGALMALLLLSGSCVGISDTLNAAPTSGYLYEIADYLEDKGLEYGYADYWESQALSVISGPDVKVRCIRTESSTNELVPYRYQSDREWYSAQKGIDEYFVLLDDADYALFLRSDRYYELADSLLYEDEIAGFRIAVFSENPIY